MTDARIAVVAEAAKVHHWDHGGETYCACGWDSNPVAGLHPAGQYAAHFATAVIAALDAYAATVPFSGRIPPVDEAWGNKAHPHGAVGAPGAVRPVGAWARSGAGGHQSAGSGGDLVGRSCQQLHGRGDRDVSPCGGLGHGGHPVEVNHRGAAGGPVNPDDWCPLHGSDGDVCDCRVEPEPVPTPIYEEW